MADSKNLGVPADLGLDLMAFFGPDFADAERKRRDDMIDKVDGIRMGDLRKRPIPVIGDRDRRCAAASQDRQFASRECCASHDWP